MAEPHRLRRILRHGFPQESLQRSVRLVALTRAASRYSETFLRTSAAGSACRGSEPDRVRNYERLRVVPGAWSSFDQATRTWATLGVRTFWGHSRMGAGRWRPEDTVSAGLSAAGR